MSILSIDIDLGKQGECGVFDIAHKILDIFIAFGFLLLLAIPQNHLYLDLQIDYRERPKFPNLDRDTLHTAH